MPIQDYFPIELNSALWRCLKRIHHLYKLSPGEPEMEEALEQSDLLKLVATFALEDQETWDVLEKVEAARSILTAEGYLLTLRAHVVGVDRLDGEDDTWLRERCLFWIYVQESHGSLPELRKIAAWFIGIYRRELNWATEYLGKINVVRKQFALETHLDTYRDLTDFVQVQVEGTLLDAWYGDSWFLTGIEGDPVQEDAVNGLGAGVTQGHHLWTDLLDLLEAVVPIGTKVGLYRLGWFITGTDDGDAVIEDLENDPGCSGPIELRGPDHVYDQETDPNGCLFLYPSAALPLIRKLAPANQLFRYGYVGRRILDTNVVLAG